MKSRGNYMQVLHPELTTVRVVSPDEQSKLFQVLDNSFCHVNNNYSFRYTFFCVNINVERRGKGFA